MSRRLRALAVVAIAVASAVPVIGSAPAIADDSAPAAASATPPRIESALVREMNRVRRAHHRPALRLSPALRRAARPQSAFLLRTDQLTHDSPDGSPFWKRIVAAGYPRNRWMAENLAYLSGCDTTTARRTVAMWMASPPHRVNLLNRRYRYVGAGVASAGDCSLTYATADYGS
jgi:uncharacterized protein YkwD